MGKFLTVDVLPDMINGDVSDLAGADIDAGDIMFDWVAVDVPKGSVKLTSISAWANAEDGALADGSLTDIELVLAKSVNGIAPPSMGTIGAAQTGCGELRHHIVGALRLESVAAIGTLSKLTFGVAYMMATTSNGGAGGNGACLPIVIDLEPESGVNVGYDKLYVAGFQVAARNWETGVLLNESTIDASANPTSTIIVDGVDATKIFSVGDQVYVMDLDTPIPGTLTKVEPLLLTFSETNSTVDITENDELLNANPFRLKLGFES